MAKKRGKTLRLISPGDHLDVGVYNPARYFSVCPANESGMPTTPQVDWTDRQAAQRIVSEGQLLYAQLAEDNDFVARFRLGDASSSEDEEWICRIVGRLSLPHGRLWCNRVVVEVPPGEYLADLRCYLPCVSAKYALEWRVKPAIRDSAGYQKYWQQTRRKEPRPSWLLQAQLDVVEDVDEANQLEEEMGDRMDETHVEFLVRLAILPSQVILPPTMARDSFFGEARPKGHPKPAPTDPYCCVWECRRPTLCPQGIQPGEILAPGI